MPETVASSEDPFEKYKRIQVYEHHFNTLETEIRKLASVWLLAALGAIAYILGKGIVDKSIDALLLIAITGFLGTLGLMLLWILDQQVYHKLLNAVFLLGMRLEYKYEHLPPIRTLMMSFSEKQGMARYMRWYYLGPMYALGIIAIVAGIIYSIETEGARSIVAILFGVASAIITLVVHMITRQKDLFYEIALEFGDKKFATYLREGNFSEVLSKH